MKYSIVSQDISPQEATYFSGYSRDQKSKGTHDPLLVTLTILVTDAYQLFIFSFDLLNVSKPFSDRLTREVNLKFPDTYNIVLVTAIHTHSGPAIFPLPSLYQDIDPKLQELLFKQSAELIADGFQSLTTIDQILMTRGQIEGLYGNRNQKEGDADKSFMVLNFMKDQQRIGAIVSLACHPTVLKSDNLWFSADIFGVIRKRLNHTWRCPVMMLNGACGDTSSRFYSRAANFEEAERIGTAITTQIENTPNMRPLSLELVKAGTHQEAIYYDAKADVFWQEKAKEIDQIEPLEMRQALKTHLENKFYKINKVTFLESQQILFKELGIITFSGELSAHFAKQIYQSVDCPVLIIGYEHGYVSYLVENDNYGHYFESYLTRLPKGQADLFVQHSLQTLKDAAVIQ